MLPESFRSFPDSGIQLLTPCLLLLTTFPIVCYTSSMSEIRNLPIGIQSFEEIRTKGCVYVDKTQFIRPLLSVGKPYFLSRPRRFGKSLFLSTLKAYFEGKKDLFTGLEISKTETEWKKYPVIYFDFNIGDFTDEENFRASIGRKLDEYEKIYGIRNEKATSPSDRFSGLIKQAHEKTGLQAAILIDEYDKPLLNAIGHEGLVDRFRMILKSFYGVIKGEDEHIRFVFITGVTRFDKVSIFSDLNNLNDISLSERFTGICGITQEELENCFVPEIKAIAEKNDLSEIKTLSILKQNYDGYHFSQDTKTDVYNPFSLLNAFYNKSFGSYWFSTGTPTFLTVMMRDINFDYKSLEEGIEVGMRSLENYRLTAADPLPMLYQTGYVTIKSYDKEFRSFTLGLPNDEVKYGLYESLIPFYAGYEEKSSNIEVLNFLSELRAGKVDAFMERINWIFASAPKKTNQRKYELDCQAFVWLIFKLMGEFILCEVQNGKGRSDAVVWEKNAVYIFEFKIDGTAEEALAQINSNNYPIAYMNEKAQGKKIIKVGVNYSSTEEQLTNWLIEEE